MHEDTDRVRARLPCEVLDALSRMAKKRKTSVSSLLEDLLTECLTAKGELPAVVYISCFEGNGSIEVFKRKVDADRCKRLTGLSYTRVEVK